MSIISALRRHAAIPRYSLSISLLLMILLADGLSPSPQPLTTADFINTGLDFASFQPMNSAMPMY